jgi:hypothetical protein
MYTKITKSDLTNYKIGNINNNKCFLVAKVCKIYIEYKIQDWVAQA